MDREKIMEYVKKLWSQVDRKSLMTIVLVGLIALGYMFPKPTPDMSGEVGALKERITVLEIDVQTALKKATAAEIRIAALESKPDRSSEIASAIQSAEGVTAKVRLLEEDIVKIKNTLSSFQTGSSSTDLATINSMLTRLNVLEIEVAALQSSTGGGTSTVNTSGYSYSVILPFNTNCSWHRVFGTTWYGQQFVMSSWNMNVGEIRLYLRRGGAATDCIVRLYNLGTNGLPTGTPVWIATVNNASWSTTGQWVIFPVTGLTLTANARYGITIASPNGNETNNTQFGYNDPGSYASGSLIGTLTAGNVWTISAGQDIGLMVGGTHQ